MGTKGGSVNERQRKELANAQVSFGLAVSEYQKLQGQLLLVHMPNHGIQKAYLTDVKSMFPRIALRFAGENVDEGDYFDSGAIHVYHVYSEQDEAKVVEQAKELRERMSQSADGKVPITIVPPA